jgi:DNA-binding HxlR family transcriptional regulator
MATTAPVALPLHEPDDYCAGGSCAREVSRAVGVLAGRWAVPVLEALYFAPEAASRFRELQRRVAGISQKELSRQLGNFVNLGVAQRIEQLGAPQRVDYQLTPRGRELMKHMDGLGQWARAAVGLATLAPLAAQVAGDPAVPAASWLSPLGVPVSPADGGP